MTIHASVVVTAEHNAPVYPSEKIALAKVGNKNGSGHNCRWAIWLTKGDDAWLIESGIQSLGLARTKAEELANQIRDSFGVDELGGYKTKVVCN